MKIKSYISALIIVLYVSNINAQDPQFSQFFAAPNYLNPAFAGATFGGRATLNYRNEWPTIPKSFVSYNVAIDANIKSIKSGLGLLLTRDKAGTGGLQFTNVAMQFAHQFTLKKGLYIRPAIQYAYTWRSIDYADLVFGDQLIRNDAPTTVDLINYQKVSYFDFSSGFLLYSNKNWIGASAHHINKPNESLLQDEAGLPIKYSIHGGMKLELETIGNFTKKDKMNFAANYKAQGKYDQFDLGLYFVHEPVIIGVWYRGIPGLKAYEPGYQNNDAIVLLIGAEIKQLKFGYSYDITISRLVSNTSGSHEISLSYQWASKDAPPLSKQKRNVPCPKF